MNLHSRVLKVSAAGVRTREFRESFANIRTLNLEALCWPIQQPSRLRATALALVLALTFAAPRTNVWEWASDPSGSDRVTMGGSWWYGPAQTQADWAQWKPADFYAVYIGLRCAYPS